MNTGRGNDYSEDALVEQPVIRLFQDLDWETANCFDETFLPGGGSLGRETPEEVVLVRRLKPALKKMKVITQLLPPEHIHQAFQSVDQRDRRPGNYT